MSKAGGLAEEITRYRVKERNGPGGRAGDLARGSSGYLLVLFFADFAVLRSQRRRARPHKTVK